MGGGRTYAEVLQADPEGCRQLRRKTLGPSLKALHRFREWLREESAAGEGPEGHLQPTGVPPRPEGVAPGKNG